MPHTHYSLRPYARAPHYDSKSWHSDVTTKTLHIFTHILLSEIVVVTANRLAQALERANARGVKFVKRQLCTVEVLRHDQTSMLTTWMDAERDTFSEQQDCSFINVLEHMDAHTQ